MSYRRYIEHNIDPATVSDLHDSLDSILIFDVNRVVSAKFLDADNFSASRVIPVTMTVPAPA
jgi:hypothetical protein